MVPVVSQDAKAARPPTMRTLLRFLTWMIQTDPRYSIVLLVLQFATGLLPAASVWVVRALFDRSLAVYEGHLPVTDMLVWIALWVVLALTHVVFRLELFSLLVERLKQEMEDRLLTQLQRKASVLRLETFERADFHDVLRRAQEAASPGFFLNLIGEIHTIITGTLTVASVALVVGLWNPLLLIAIALVSVPPPLARILQEKNTFLLKREQTQRERLRAYLERILTERAAAKEVRVFNLGAALLGWWEHLYWQVADRLFRQRRSQSLVNILLSAFSLAGLAAGIGWSAWAVAHGGLSPGQFAAMMVALQQVCTHVDLVFWRFGYLGNRLLYIADLFTYLDLGPEDPKGGEPIDRVGEVSIAVSSLSFRYPQAERPAIDDISFTIQPGERVALVGANGSGKTTLVKVLLGLFHPTEGKVLYGDIDLNQADRNVLWDQSTAVFQDYTRFAFSLGENIGLGRTERMGDQAAVEHAAHQGGAAPIAEHLPKRYQTLLTKEFAGGTELSGGEWQRVAISRGFMRNAALIVLDEPTASLDPQAEADVFRRFLAMSGERTTIVVSHRLGSARLCDRILVLKEGHLLENGTHGELLSQGGEYARLWALQALWYGEERGTR